MKKYLFTLAVLFAFLLVFTAGCRATEPEPAPTVPVQETVTPKTVEPAPEEPVDNTPAPAEETTKPEETREESFTMLVVGDNLYHDATLASAYDPDAGTYDFTPFYRYVKPYIQAVDLAVANLEVVIAGKEQRFTGYPESNRPDEALHALKDAGFDLLLTANNHSLDRGVPGLVRTIEKIEEYGMLSTGTQTDPEIRWTDVEAKGLTIRNMCYTFALNGNEYKMRDDQSYMVNMLDEKMIKAHIDRARMEEVDLIVVYLHWGVEYVLEPHRWQEEFAVRLFEYGADIIFATHAHVVQKSEVHHINGKDRYIIYSTGNFVSNFTRNDTSQRSNKLYTEDGVMVQATFTIREDNSVILEEVVHIPTWVYIHRDGQDKRRYAIIPVKDGEELRSIAFHPMPAMEYMLEEAMASYRRTFERVVDFKRSID
ncbi:MAG: CapA family protein [Clostridia bacterium]